ncbi:MAG: carboxypeptidase-like regulatory domain-containing protein, partial [Acidobacteriota bacterium]|nr:carboxypeptidase-like regulatory domain-containing protein [Acidobacteriota bacterium]
MRHKNLIAIAVFLTAAVFIVPATVVRSAGGRIEGKVVDAKGGPIAGASITVNDPDINQTLNAIADNDGNYKVEGLAAGTYTVVISAKGFATGRVENVKIDGTSTVPVNLKLEVAAVEAEVTVGTAGLKANTDPVYQHLRLQSRSEQSFTGN